MDLLKAKRDIISDDSELLLSAIRKDIKKTYYDINARDNQGQTDLMIACFCGDLALVKELVSFGADVDIVTYNSENAAYYTILGVTIHEKIHDSTAILDMLAKNKINLNVIFNSRCTALGLACIYDLTDITQKLISLNADVHLNSPLVLACQNNSIDSIYSICTTAKNVCEIETFRDEIKNTDKTISKDYAIKILESIDVNLKLNEALSGKTEKHWGIKNL